jgi:uncharacterized membrane protein YesL
VAQQATMALKVLGLALRDTWQELWTILIVNLLFIFANLLVITGPPATLALFFYANRIAHEERATERDFLQAMRTYWKPAWRWGFLNILIIGLLTGDYFLIETLTDNATMASLVQGLYLALLASWLLLQLFTVPFLFEQTEPRVGQALQNAAVFLKKNLIFAIVFALLLALSLIAGTLLFMLTLAFGGAFVAFAGNHAVLRDLAEA